MGKCRITKYEKETIILFNEAEPTANVYTYNTALKNRLAKFSRDNPNCAKLITTYPCGADTRLTKSVCQSAILPQTAKNAEQRRENTHRSIT